MQTYLLVLVAMGALFYFMILRPQQRAKREKQALLDALRVGVEVLTVGGIYGTVVEVRDEDLELEIAEDVVLRVDRRAIASIVPDEDADLDDEDLDEDDESVAAHDEPVDAAVETAAEAPVDEGRSH